MIGEYIRTRKGQIRKIESEEQLDLIENFFREMTGGVKSHSKNIKDLVEGNDYVNGNKVIDINGILYVTDEGVLSNIEIKSIMTKEQFKEMEYRV